MNENDDFQRELARMTQRSDQAAAAYAQTVIAGYVSMLRALRAEGLSAQESMEVLKTIVHARETTLIAASVAGLGGGRGGEPKT